MPNRITQAGVAQGEQIHGADNRKPTIVRNIYLYVAGVMSLSVAGGIISASGQEIGGLVFLLGPLLMTILLRTFGGDGWADTGLRLGPARWHLFGLAIFPVSFALILGVGVLTGTVTLAGTFRLFLAATALEVLPRLVFAGFEEVGWRGYLEPRFVALGVADVRRHTIVGLIWAVWHIPYIMSTSGYSDLPIALFVPLLMTGVLVMAFVYGQMRLKSGSVWPVVLAHGMGNILAYPLIFGDFAVFEKPAIIATRPESILFIVIWGAITWGLMRRRPQQR